MRANDVTEAELAVLQSLWDQGTTTIRELVGVLYPQETPAQYATVQKLLERLEAKRFVERDRDNWPHRFRASTAREELIGRRLQDLADQLCEGSLQPLLVYLQKLQLLSPSKAQRV